MSKGDKRRGNREIKKPKAVKSKAVTTANFMKGATPVNIGEKKKP